MRLAVALVASAMLACSSAAAPPEEAWAGRYDMDLGQEHRPCADPSAEPALTSDTGTWELRTGGATGLFIDGDCDLPLVAVDATTATFVETSCAVEIAGVTGTVYVVEGSLARAPDGSISGDQRLRYELDDDSCDVVDNQVIGTRLP